MHWHMSASHALSSLLNPRFLSLHATCVAKRLVVLETILVWVDLERLRFGSTWQPRMTQNRKRWRDTVVTNLPCMGK